MRDVVLKKTSRLNEGHLWVFSNEIASDLKLYEKGEIVAVKDRTGRFYGIGYINPHSLISIRLLSKQQQEINSLFFSNRIQSALSYRRKILSSFDTYRLIYSEGDFLPGLIVDIYNNCMVIQILTAGIERLKDTITDVLDDLIKPEIIVLRNDSQMRNLEGLPLYKKVIKGNIDKSLVVINDGVITEISPLEGQKTGGFLDQRLNRKAFAKLLTEDMVGLDLFCYGGEWGLQALKVAKHVTFVDDSNHAIEMTQRNLKLNGLFDKASVIKSDAFVFLKNILEEDTFDFIILDPPAFVKNKTRIKQAIKGYIDINSLAMNCIKSGGLMATSSCSHHIDRETFLEILRKSSKESGRSIRIIEFRGQAPDHPVLLNVPETEYLKCVFLEVI